MSDTGIDGIQKPNRQILLACEGKRTEPEYFKAMFRDRHLRSTQAAVLPFTHSDPLFIIESLVKAIRKREAECSASTIFEPWAVFDVDERQSEDSQRWGKALRLAELNGICLAISNPCFELWFLLHCRDWAKAASGKEVRIALRQELSYSKSESPYDQLRDETETAIKRACALHRERQRLGFGKYDNPSCQSVATLVESILSLEILERTQERRAKIGLWRD